MILESNPDMFPVESFNWAAIKYLLCVLEEFGSFYSFNWLGIPVLGDGFFLG